MNPSRLEADFQDLNEHRDDGSDLSRFQVDAHDGGLESQMPDFNFFGKRPRNVYDIRFSEVLWINACDSFLEDVGKAKATRSLAPTEGQNVPRSSQPPHY